jgi:hypothetical protein
MSAVFRGFCFLLTPQILVCITNRMKSCLDRIKSLLPDHTLAKRAHPFASSSKAVFPHFLSFQTFSQQQGRSDLKPTSNIAALMHHSSVANRAKDCNWMLPEFSEGMYSCSAVPVGTSMLGKELIKFANYASPNPSERLSRALLLEDLRELVACRYIDQPAVSMHVFGSHGLGLGIFSSDIDMSISGLLDEEQEADNDQSGDRLAAKFADSCDRLEAEQKVRERQEAEITSTSEGAAAARAKVLALASAHARYTHAVIPALADESSHRDDGSDSSLGECTSRDGADGPADWVIDTVPEMLEASNLGKRKRVSEGSPTLSGCEEENESSESDSDSDSDSDHDNDHDDEDQIDLNLNTQGAAADGDGNVVGGQWASYSSWSIRNQQLALLKAQSDRRLSGVERTIALQEERKNLVLRELRALMGRLRVLSYVHSLEFISKARVPIISVSHVNGVEVDISVGVSANDTTDIIKAMVLTVYNHVYGARVQLDSKPGAPLQPEVVTTIRDLYYPPMAFLKVFLALTGVNKPFSGGLGAFKVYVMLTKILLSFRPFELRLDSNSNPPPGMADAGAVLMRFLEYFGSSRNMNARTEIHVELTSLPFDGSERPQVCTEFRAQFKVDYCSFLFRTTHQTLHALMQANWIKANRQTANMSYSREDSLLGCVLDIREINRQRSLSNLKAEIYNRTRLGSDAVTQHLATFESGGGAALYSSRKDVAANAMLSKLYRQIVQENANSGKRSNIYSVFSQVTIEDVKALDLGLYGRLRGNLSSSGSNAAVRSQPVGRHGGPGVVSLSSAKMDDCEFYSDSSGGMANNEGSNSDNDSDVGGDGLDLLDYARLRYQSHNVFTGKDSNGNSASTSAGTGGMAKRKFDGDRRPARKKQKVASNSAREKHPEATKPVAGAGKQEHKKQSKGAKRRLKKKMAAEGVTTRLFDGNGDCGRTRGETPAAVRFVKAAPGNTVGSVIKEYEQQKKRDKGNKPRPKTAAAKVLALNKRYGHDKHP